MAEEDRVDISEEVNPPIPTHSQPPPTHAPPPPTPAGVPPAHSGTPSTHLSPPTSSGAPLPRVPPASSASDDHARITALEGTINQLAASMTTNMAELFALLRGPNRASSSSTPPSGQGSTIDPTSWIPPTQVSEATDAPAPPTMNTSTVHLFTSPFPPPPAPSAVPLPPAAFLSSEQALSAPPPVSMSALAAVYTVPPPMVFPASSAPAPTHFQAAELPPYPSLQPHVGLPYQAPPPINTTFLEPSTPTHAAYLFSGMRLPSKVKIPKFRIYEGTTDPQHHLRHYQGKMLQYWDYEEFVIHSFQDSLSGSALDWFMSLKAKDIPTWADLSRKFIDQYQYCAETPPTLLELSMKEMTQGRKFEEYATKWLVPLHPKGSVLFASVGSYFVILRPHRGREKARLGDQAWQDGGPHRQRRGICEEDFRDASLFQWKKGERGLSQRCQSGAPNVPTVLDKLDAPTACCSRLHPVGAAIPTSTPIARRPSLRIYSTSSPPVLTRIFRSSSVGSAAQGPSINMIGICALEEGESEQGGPSPFVIEHVPMEATVGFAGIGTSPTPFVIDIPAREPYSDDKVPWTYEGGVGNLERQFRVMGVTRSGRLYENPAAVDKGKTPTVEVEAIPGAPPTPPKKVTEEETEAFVKIIKASEYKVVEQMAKSPAHVSLLALLLSSEPHREALMRVLTAAQVPKGTPPDRIEETVSSIFSNTISFPDDKLPSEGCAHSRALYIVCKCNNHIVGRVMIDNGSAFNVCPVTTLKKMNVDLNHVRPSKTVKLKFIVEERLIMVKGEEDYAIYKETAVPYISVGNDENLPFHSFETISVIRDYGEIGPSCADRMIGKGSTAPLRSKNIRIGEDSASAPPAMRSWKPAGATTSTALPRTMGGSTGAYKFPRYLIFFPGPPHIIGSTLDGPSSDSDDAPVTPPDVYAVTEEIPLGVHIRLAQENEELNNWTSVPRYSAMIADV
ncbi:hypothetical protein CRG98_019522 [Punica granatum]|uniref:Retrotransposon gag domain-containing protein n=1 Tax=Punica granatum TaxID=22663 RepID=A0A2I0JUT7_PUNGR|nr:hypothetical protein CRG98_019522 [Punica granatum]